MQPVVNGIPTVGPHRHAAAVERLSASYRAIPPGAPVRLAKRTSNLFRPRTRLDVPGLDVSGLDRVISIDPEGRTADVQGMCTYEDLVDATLPHGLMPYVVPQLRTITLGGAVTGLGIESSSFRNGLPHESVLEMDVLTGSGEVVTAAPGGPNDELFRTFPNSYGSLGYATRIRIALEPVQPRVRLRHVRVPIEKLDATVARLVETHEHDGDPVDFLDGVAFSPDEVYLTLGTWDPTEGPGSDYTGQRVFYRSLQERSEDVLTTLDYLWRWDTDWFWCSRAFGAQHPAVRRVWPRRWRRSDVYHRLVGLEHRFGAYARVQRLRGRPDVERVVQDVEIPVGRVADFLGWFDERVGMRPVWLCPLRLRDADGPGSARAWPLYPLEPGRTYVNVGFWGAVPIAPGAEDGDVNRAIEDAVTAHGGHKSLYSDAYYTREEFDRLYAGSTLTEVRRIHDPDDRLTGLYEKAVARR
ncbi:FAD-binding oxidoreductase [Nocardioides guangzhouensis]|uniref:FAD-binding oxidoreductase n=1 Tax=Nocardioides guangzhouensis TaxID=2497878 RepID=UPI001FECC5F0|nr:FAD-binding oxidoreductase [Nocardioides guangzhouensis]